MIKIKVRKSSINKVRSNLRKINNSSILEGAKVGSMEIMQIIMDESTNEAECPYDTRTLVSTAHIEKPQVTNSKILTYAGYAGKKDKMNPKTGLMTSAYAEKVHETPGTPPGGGYYHPHGKWKFLSDPFLRHVNEVVNVIGEQIRIRLRSTTP
jgi:hypothetical protein